MTQEILELDATAQAGLVARGEVSPAELVEASIAQIEAGEPVLNAVTQRFFGQALDSAKSGLPDGPFRGVPFLVKDFYCHMAGTPTTGSARLLEDNVIDHDSALMSRYRGAGFVTLGKTNVPEMVTMGTTEPVWRGATRNPWNITHTPGGSSGGAAAAVAARYVAAAHANDGAGSIRIPASCCGLFGLKPSRGRVTLGPDVGEAIGGITAEHVVTRSVRDSAAILDATAGPLAGDPYIAPPPARPFLDELEAPRQGLRIGVTFAAPDGTDVAPECVAAVEHAAGLLRELGHQVEEVTLPFDGRAFRAALGDFWPLTVTRGLSAIAAARGQDPELLVRDLEPFNQYLFSKGITRRAVDYIRDLVGFQGMARAMGGFYEIHDLWLSPTLAFAPPPLGYFDAGALGGEEAWKRVLDSFAFTAPGNVTGLPSASIPMDRNAAGLPIGIQLTARLNDEAVLFNVAGQLETANPWALSRPLL
ncbi:amidase [Mesorhizobium sp. L-8-3]|uniref:amidase n=1 Tax=Mesorhizobium sp. L-8-3 TaxID=2744522 RepID=UPI0019296B7F|nr:amidase [Mesorhizobium sp. L-8-3]BCH27934.1 6-aminohexanoate-cyclic-dimer hydrolase [Mesorhizobium sp. L-8-3]